MNGTCLSSWKWKLHRLPWYGAPTGTEDILDQWFISLGPQDWSGTTTPTKFCSAQLMVEASGSFSLRTSGDSWLGTTILDAPLPPQNLRVGSRLCRTLNRPIKTNSLLSIFRVRIALPARGGAALPLHPHRKSELQHVGSGRGRSAEPQRWELDGKRDLFFNIFRGFPLQNKNKTITAWSVIWCFAEKTWGFLEKSFYPLRSKSQGSGSFSFKLPCYVRMKLIVFLIVY